LAGDASKRVGHARLLGQHVEARWTQLLPSVEHDRPLGFRRLNVEGDRLFRLQRSQVKPWNVTMRQM
jgi:hypothetical protein